MYISAIEGRGLLNALLTIDGQPFKINLYRDIDKFWRLRMNPYVPGAAADRARDRFRKILDQDGWNDIKESKRLVEAAIRRSGAEWSGWEAEGNDEGGGRQVGGLGEASSQPFITVIEGGGISVGSAIALLAGVMMKEGAVRAFLIGVGGSVAGAAIYSVIQRKKGGGE